MILLSVISFSALEQAFQNPVVIAVLAVILVLLGILIGYLIGNTTLQSKVSGDMDNLERDKLIQKAVLDTVGLGIAVYDSKGALFCNETIFSNAEAVLGSGPRSFFPEADDVSI